MKYAVLLILCYITVACGNSAQRAENATGILKSVEEQYKSMKTFELQAVLNSTIKAVGKNQNTSFPIYYARREPGEIRIEVRGNQMGLTIVSDGN
ncbi:MAG: hypothetical protein PVI44_04195, partial [Balneolaceae bacterium]